MVAVAPPLPNQPRKRKRNDMKERELLELAAKAAGIPIHVWGAKGKELIADMTEPDNHKLWNPLTDDGDALRLAVKLRMRLRVDDYGAAARINDKAQWAGCEAHIHGGIEAATRRAIVRAAAEIGLQHK